VKRDTFLLVTGLLIAQLAAPNTARAQRRAADLFRDKTSIENPLDLRDPFKPPLRRVARDRGGRQSRGANGVYTNIARIGDVDTRALMVVGVIMGKERYAIAKVTGKEGVFKLTEGMRLGADNAELKAIHPGGIILVEKLVNVYGEEEYLETVIPISK